MKTYNHDWIKAEWQRMGKPIRETLDPSDGLWLELYEEDCDFFENELYRIKSKPSINWEHVSDDVLAMATYQDGGTFLFASAPNMTGKYGISGGGIICNANVMASFTQGTCDWKDSLVMRPICKE